MKEEKRKAMLEASRKRFNQLLEYMMPNSDILGEDDKDKEEGAEDLSLDQDEQQQQQGGNQEQGPADNMGMGSNDMQQQPQQGGSDDVASGFQPQTAEGGADEMGMGEQGDENTAQPGDEVVDVSDLTDAQKESQKELSQFNDKFSAAIKAIDSLKNMIEKNDEKIEQLNAEIKKRNPTPIEKMSNRASNAYPFCETPTKYWKKKEKTSNYSTEDDNNGRDDERYTITVGDINNSSDWKSISDSISDDFLQNQTLDKLMRM